MLPESYTTITISDNLTNKLTRMLARHDCATYAEAIKYAVDSTLVQEEKITIRELVQFLSERVDEIDEEVLQ